MSRTVLLSTGGVTRDPVQTDHRQIVEHGPALGTPGLELAVYRAWYGHLDDVVSDLRETGLSFPIVHGEKGIGAGLGSGSADAVEDALERFELNCRAAAALGSKTLVLHLWEKPESDGTISRNLEHLPALLDTAAAYDVTVAVETIPGDAATPLSNIRLGLERDSRMRVTLDSEFLAFHGELGESVAADWLWQGQFVHHVHLKDFDGRLREGESRRYLLPGEGRLDIQGFLDALAERGYAGLFTIEASAIGPDGQLDPARLAQMAAVAAQLSA